MLAWLPFSRVSGVEGVANGVPGGTTDWIQIAGLDGWTREELAFVDA